MPRMIYLVLMALIMLTGCLKEAELTISNNTPLLAKVSIDGIIYELPAGGEPAKETYYLNSYLLFGESVKVPVEYIQTTPYRSQKRFNVEMKPGRDKSYHVKFNRGQLQFWNLAPVTIYSMKIRETDDDEWSDNLLDDVVYSEENEVIPIEDGIYFVRLVDPNGFEYEQFEIEIIAGETLPYYFWG
ncbi:MAG: hypothetical protein Q7J16_08010 [Candidatus Cloacimonadales bacterium]|nr:hypothetical protein [Candidatus Cloacimonadales bacterium]